MLNNERFCIIAFGIDFGGSFPLQERVEFEGFMSLDDMLFSYLKFPDARRYDCIRRYRVALQNHWEQVGVEILNFTHDGVPHWMVAARKKSLVTSKGFPVTVDPAFWSITDQEQQKVRDFCTFFELPATEPKWFVFP